MNNVAERLDQIEAARQYGYEKGVTAAWDCALKLCTLDRMRRIQLFGKAYPDVIMRDNSAADVMDKLDEYESKVVIKVGDEVKGHQVEIGTVLRVDGEYATVLAGDGVVWRERSIYLLKKTGRHFPIDGILEQMKEMPVPAENWGRE